jgi:hypothetical protein
MPCLSLSRFSPSDSNSRMCVCVCVCVCGVNMNNACLIYINNTCFINRTCQVISIRKKTLPSKSSGMERYMKLPSVCVCVCVCVHTHTRKHTDTPYSLSSVSSSSVCDLLFLPSVLQSDSTHSLLVNWQGVPQLCGRCLNIFLVCVGVWRLKRVMLRMAGIFLGEKQRE